MSYLLLFNQGTIKVLFTTLVLQVADNIVIVVTGDLLVAQTTTPIVSSSVEKSSDATSVDETFVVHPTLEVATT